MGARTRSDLSQPNLSGEVKAYHLGVTPPGDLYDHVENSLGFVGEERNVVEGRDDDSILLRVNAVLCPPNLFSCCPGSKGVTRAYLGCLQSRLDLDGEGDS